ncbi:hypothetical protein V8E54_011262 [Elaphomyces granulatus]
MDEEYKVILRSMGEWMDWIETIRMIAEGLEVWEYMDPEVEPQNILMLNQPTKPSPRLEATTVHLAELEIFKYELRKWSEKKAALREMKKKILQTIGKTVSNFIKDPSFSNPYQMLRDLRAKLRPDNAVHKNIFTMRRKKLQHFPSRDKNIEDCWMNEDDTYYDELASVGYFNTSEPNAVEEFIDLQPNSEFKSSNQQVSGGDELENLAKSKATSESMFANPQLPGKSMDDTIQASDDEPTEQDTTPSIEFNHGILTPDQTPKPTDFGHTSPPSNKPSLPPMTKIPNKLEQKEITDEDGDKRPEQPIKPASSSRCGNREPQEIRANIGEDNIIEGLHTRNRKQAHIAAIQYISQFIRLISTFETGLSNYRRLYYKDDMLPSLGSDRAHRNRKFRQQYLDTRNYEWTDLITQGTFDPGIRPVRHGRYQMSGPYEMQQMD